MPAGKRTPFQQMCYDIRKCDSNILPVFIYTSWLLKGFWKQVIIPTSFVFMIVGLYFLDECPPARAGPTSLVSIGILGLMGIFVMLKIFIMFHGGFQKEVLICFGTGFVSWTILGLTTLIRLLRTNNLVELATAPPNCSPVIYYVSLGFIISSVAAVPLHLIGYIAVKVYASCFFPVADEEADHAAS